MALTHFQKNYIKKHIKTDSLSSISNYLSTDENQILDYLEKKWGKDKLNNFLKTHKEEKPPIPEIKSSPSQSSWFFRNWPYIFLPILVLITYINALNNAFVSDDIAEILNNPKIGDLSTVLGNPFGALRLIIYWVIFHIAGLNPLFFRLFNLIFHIGNVLLVFAIFSTKFPKKLALIVASLFAIHPAISEPIVWISGGNYPQYSFFFLLSFFLYLLSEKGKFFYWSSVFIYFLSLQSHPAMPLALFLLFPLWEFCFGNLKKNWLKSIPFFLIAIGYVFINLGGLPERETTLQSVHYQEKGVDNPLILLPISISSYLELIFYPKVLTLYHSELAFSTFQMIIRFVVLILFLVGLVVSFFKNKFIFFYLSLFLIALAPSLTPFRLNWIVAERYNYLPSIGIFAVFAYLLIRIEKQIKKFKFILPIFMVIILTLLATRTFFRNIDWYSEDNLWIATGKTSPSSPNTHNNLGDVYGRNGNKQKALQEFQTAILLKPNYADAYHNLANTYHELGDDVKALENYMKAAELNPKLWQSYQNIAALYYQQQKYDLALEYIQKAVEINPKNINLWANLGLVHMSLGNKDKAKEVFTQILSSDPQNLIAKQALIELNK